MSETSKTLPVPMSATGGVTPCEVGEYVGVFVTHSDRSPFVMSLASHALQHDAVEDARAECMKGEWNLEAGDIVAGCVVPDEEYEGMLKEAGWETVNLLGLRRIN